MIGMTGAPGQNSAESFSIVGQHALERRFHLGGRLARQDAAVDRGPRGLRQGVDEVAQVLGLGEETIRSHLCRASSASATGRTPSPKPSGSSSS